MMLVGMPSEQMKATSLILNILVASVATTRFARAGCLKLSVLWPFALAAIPMAWLGGNSKLPEGTFKVLVGIVLLVAAWHLSGFWTPKALPTEAGLPGAQPAGPTPTSRIRSPALNLISKLSAGGAIGLTSGLTGTGGGIFLSPLLLLMGWADARTTAGVSAAFILLNSIAGLVGHLPAAGELPVSMPLWLVCVGVGALIGSELGARRLSPRGLRQALSVVLVIAGLKFILPAASAAWR
jgi:hypothetical protein